ncbi:NEDD4-binding protein 2 [Archocentrus centrarchus]|uniref:NEDD4-binding protein 2 n=1 Tax=Archocentrus centrarchus TaxID=63155 RepID=UPI0011E9C2D2|nr:NEDD4-binding protein 2 [Archocentrus centrarchus]
MPRRKKNGQSPARLPDGGPTERGNLGHSTSHPLPQAYGGAMSSNFPPNTVKEKIVRQMQEMFSHLDPEVIYIVLSECDFKVENAMDSLLELSVAAEGTPPAPPPVSGFELTAAALLGPQHFSEPRPDTEPSKPSQQPSSPPSSTLLTEELDLLVDRELETLTAQQDVDEEHRSSKYLSAGALLSSFPPPPLPQQALPELLQSSLEHGSRGPSAEQLGPGGYLTEHKSGDSSSLDQLSTWEQKNSEGQQSVVNFAHLMTETSADTLKPPLDLAASGRPSAFQVYKKQDPTDTISENAGVMHTDGGARSKMNTANPEPLDRLSPRWNLEAPVFFPRMHGNQMPAFITPVAQTPSNWLPPWLSQGHLSQAPLKPFATIPKSWALPAAPQLPAHNSRLCLEGKVLVLLRGAPGSGKSTLARTLLEHNPGGAVLSTDDYFTRNGEYQFDPTALGEAHEWNHKRAKEAFEKGTNPIIIDNTNMQGWEMKPYVAQALKHGYRVLFREPDTWWKHKPKELVRRTTHSVHVESIRRMLEGYERFVTVQSIMRSQMPELKRQLLLQNRSSQLTSSEAPCPDLVGQPRSAEGCQTSSSQLFSSLPDVSSVGCSGEVGMTEDGTHKSTESLNFQLGEKPTDSLEASDENDDMDLGELDSELDAHLELNHPVEEQRMPDCIVESVMNEDHCGDEMSVAFSESIRQRLRRERTSRRMEPADLVKDTNQLDSGTKVKEIMEEEEVEGAEVVRYTEEKDIPKTLNFLGDWPSEGPLKQREVRKRERHKEMHGKEDEGASQEGSEYKKTIRAQSGPDVTEAQKLLDLIQTGRATVSASSSLSPSLSLSSGEASEREDEADRSSEESHGSRSNSKERKRNMNRINGSRGDLPDCVLDWKPADSGIVRESRTDDSDGLKIENEGCSEEERKSTKPEIGTGIMSAHLNPANKENPSSVLATNLVDDSKTLEVTVCSNDMGNHSIEDEAAPDVNISKYTENDRETAAETDGTYLSETCQTPVCEGSVETESSPSTGGGQEGKLRQGRRSGKQCKLALTFTQNCPLSVDCPDTKAQNSDCCHNSSVGELNFNSNTSFDLKPNLDLSKFEASLEPPLLNPADTGCFTQTEPRDFALLWRLNHQTNPDDTASSACTSDLGVLYGDSSRFVPELSSAVSAADAVHPSGHREVPYRVVHEKGTQVGEKELGVTRDRLESLCILSRHFKLVSFDTLEDLYDKCSQDLEWATNLLLDSGEKFFRDEDVPADSNNTSGLCAATCQTVESISCPNALHEARSEDWPKATQHSTCETVSESEESQNNTDMSNLGGAVLVTSQPDAIPSSEKSLDTDLSLPEAVKEGERSDNTEPKGISASDQDRGAWSKSLDNAIIEKSGAEIEDEIASMEEVNRLLQAELEELEREQKQRREETRSRHHLDIQSVELKLPTELALQLTELFGPVGVDPGSCSADDYAVQMDLNLAKLLHQKWKETIQERQRQAALSFHLLQESSVHWGDSQAGIPGRQDQTQSANFLINTDGYMSLGSHPEACGPMPFMDHWSASRPHVSLREIMKEEQALQNNVEKTRQSRADLDQRNGATLLKENQLYSLFPTIDRHFLQDIFRDHNYNLRETELFLHSLLNEEPVKTVVAPEAPRSDHHRAASKERVKKQKPVESAVPSYQDTEDPEYEDFRAEAKLQRSRQLESFAKAAEAYKQGRKEVASFYAQQGHLHGERVREANHRAAVQIFERVNSSLLPSNILDLHGLHVNEALEHLAQVLQDKTKECEQGLCRPQLSVITGRGNHSQGGVARIRPAVIDYLTNKHYRFTEPKPGLVLVSLK